MCEARIEREASCRAGKQADRNSLPELLPQPRFPRASRVTMAILQRLTAETYLLHDPAAGTPRQRWQQFPRAARSRACATPPRAAWTTSRHFSRRESRAPSAAAWRASVGRATRGHVFRGEFRSETCTGLPWLVRCCDGDSSIHSLSHDVTDSRLITIHESQSIASHESPVTIHESRFTHGGVPMGRGAQAQTQQMIDQQLAQQNAMNQQTVFIEPGARFAGRGGLSESARQSRLLAGAEQSAITNLSQSALSSSFDALAQNAANRAARTHNSAGYGELHRLPGAHAGPAARPTSRSKIKSPLPTPHNRTPCRRSPAFPACTARTQRCSAAHRHPRAAAQRQRTQCANPADSTSASAPAAYRSV